MTSKSPSPAPGRDALSWRDPALVALTALATCIVGVANTFSWDDLPLIVDDARVHSLANWKLFFTASYWPPPYAAELYRPLATTLYAVEWALGGGSPVAFRLASYALYAAVSLGVLRLGRRVLPPRIALGVALLFAAHPVHTEPVALAVAQAELCVALLAVTMVVTYLDHRRAGALDARTWTLLAVGYAAASLFKETGLVIPGLFVGAELVLLRDSGARGRARRLWTGYAALVAVALLVLLVRRVVLPVTESESGTFTAEALAGLGPGGRALTMLKVVPIWLRLLAWPAHLQIDYSPREIVASTEFGAAEARGVVILAAAIAAAWLARRRAPVITFGVLWIAVALFPVSNVLVPTGVLLAERTMMLPSVGFVLVAGGLAARAFAWRHVAAVELRRWLPAACVILVIAGVARSIRRQRDWVNNGMVWFRSAQDAPRSYRAQEGAGIVLFEIGADSAARVAFAKAIEYAPKPPLIRNDLAAILREKGDDSTAVAQLRASLAEDPAQPTVRTELAAALLGAGRYDEAARVAQEAIARGEAPGPLSQLAAVADSARASGARPGSVRIRVNLKAVRARYRP